MKRRQFLLSVAAAALLACNPVKEAYALFRGAAPPAAPSWNPLQFGLSLVAWGDMTNAATVTVLSGNVTQVTDRSGNGWTMSAGATSPVYQVSAFNGFPCFQGGVLQTSTSLTLNQQNTIFCLFKTPAALDATGIIWDGSTAETGSRQFFAAKNASLSNH